MAKNKQTKKHLEGNLGGNRNLAGTLNFLQIITEVKIHIRPLGTMTKLDSIITSNMFSSSHIYSILSILFSKALVQKLHLSALKAVVISPLELLSMCIIRNNTTGDHDIVSSIANEAYNFVTHLHTLAQGYALFESSYTHRAMTCALFLNWYT